MVVSVLAHMLSLVVSGHGAVRHGLAGASHIKVLPDLDTPIATEDASCHMATLFVLLCSLSPYVSTPPLFVVLL